jgi:hypothetical protein
VRLDTPTEVYLPLASGDGYNAPQLSPPDDVIEAEVVSDSGGAQERVFTEEEIFNLIQQRTASYYKHIKHLKNTAKNYDYEAIPKTVSDGLTKFGETMVSHALQGILAETQPPPDDAGEMMTHQTGLRLKNTLERIAGNPERVATLRSHLAVNTIDGLTDAHAINLVLWLEKNSEWAGRLANL